MAGSDLDLQAIRPRAEAFRRLYAGSGAAGLTTWLGVPVGRSPLDLWVYQEIVLHTRPDVVVITGAGTEGLAFYMESVVRLLGNGRVIAAAQPSSAAAQIEAGEQVMVIAAPTPAPDLEAHASLVSDGCYLVVEEATPHAVRDFLSAGTPFEVDHEREKFFVTFNPNGYLRRTHAVSSEPAVNPPPDTGEATGANAVDEFHKIFYDAGRSTWKHNQWLGPRAFKCPFDLWTYQEIVHETGPDLIVESGTGPGGSAYFLAGVCDLIGRGRIVTIDVSIAYKHRKDHPRVTYIHDSSVSQQTVATVREMAAGAERIMVLLDSDHSRDHVLAELEVYAPLVSEGNYLVVEDTNINGHPVAPEFGPGPMEALEDFLARGSGFTVDRSREKHLLTFNPKGYLRRE